MPINRWMDKEGVIFTYNVLCLVAQSWPALWDPIECRLPGSSVHGNSLGKNTGVGCHALLRGIYPTQGLNPGLLHCRQILYTLSHQGSPWILEWVAYAFSMGSSQPRDQTHVSCITGGFFTIWATREALVGGYFTTSTTWEYKVLNSYFNSLDLRKARSDVKAVLNYKTQCKFCLIFLGIFLLIQTYSGFLLFFP